MAFVLIPIITFLSLNSGKEGDGFRDKNIDRIIYEFHDSSVPPPFHRSYSIDVVPDSVHIVVDSYGDIIADTSFDCTTELFNELVSLLDDCKIKNCKLDDNNGCTGGTGETIRCYSQGEAVFAGHVYHCGGVDEGDLCGDTGKFATAVRALIPDFSNVLDR